MSKKQRNINWTIILVVGILSALRPPVYAVDCNDNGIEDACDILCDVGCNPPQCGASVACNYNGIPDECEVDPQFGGDPANDCNGDGIPDNCQSAANCNNNSILDLCEPDCNDNGRPDDCDLTAPASIPSFPDPFHYLASPACNHLTDSPRACEPQAIAAAHLVGAWEGTGLDNLVDLAVANGSFNNSSVVILRNAGKGRFILSDPIDQVVYSMPPSSPTFRPQAIIAADLTGNGMTDLATANRSSLGSGSEEDNVSVFENIGGLLVQRGPFDLSSDVFGDPAFNPVAITAANLVGSGLPDLAVANFGTDNVSILENLGGTNFAPLGSGTIDLSGPPRRPAAIAAADFNGDGRIDLATANDGQGGPNVAIVRNDGNDDFTLVLVKPVFREPSQRATSITAADLNGDGKPDLAVTLIKPHDVVVLINTTQGSTISFADPVAYQVDQQPLVSLHSIVARDFNKNGHRDLVLVKETTHELAVLSNLGDGTFEEYPDTLLYDVQLREEGTQSAVAPVALTVADFNNDGWLDVATANFANNGGVSVLLNRSAQSPDCQPNGIPDECDIGAPGGTTDCNNNGIPDDCEQQACDTGCGGSSQHNHGGQAFTIPHNSTDPIVGGPQLISMCFQGPMYSTDGGPPKKSDFALSSGSFVPMIPLVFNLDGTEVTMRIQNVTDGEPFTITWDLQDAEGNRTYHYDSLTWYVRKGDVNGDGVVDEADLAIIEANHGQSANETNFLADLDADGLIEGDEMGDDRAIWAATAQPLP